MNENGNERWQPEDEFAPAVIERLGYYVYLLSDPRDDDEVFYVGKGIGNRVFAHARGALDLGEDTPKADRIRSIVQAGHRVKTEFLRFGLDERTAFEVEAAAIQLLGLSNLLNAVSGHGSLARGRMSTDDAISLFQAEPIDVDVSAILIRPSRMWYPGMSTDDLYEATSGWWKLGPRREKAKYAFAVVHGVVRSAWRIDGWRPRREGDREWQDDPPGKPRWGFVGRPAPELERYLRRSVGHYWKRGAQSPFAYVNC